VGHVGAKMHTVAMVTQKGGSGKTTLAMCLAVAAWEAGERVFLIDMDPQRSLTRCCQRRSDNALPIEAVSAANLPEALAILEQRGVTLVIIDTPASDSPVTDAAIRAASLCLIPVRPTIFDIWASEVTRQKIKIAAKPFSFVLNQCAAAQYSKRLLDSVASLEQVGGLIQPFIVSRIAYQEAMLHAQGPTEFEPAGKAAEEVRALWNSLARRLGTLQEQRFSVWQKLGAL